MAMKVSYNYQIHRVSPPEDYSNLISTVASKYPDLSSKPLNFYYMESPEHKVNVVGDNYKQLLESTRQLKIFVEVDDAAGAEKIKQEETKPLDVQENIEEKIVKEEREKVSMDEIEALQAELLISLDDMTYVSRIFDRVKERVLQKSHVFGAFLVFTNSVANYQKMELFNKLTNSLQINKEDLIKDKAGLVVFTENASDLHKALEFTQEWCNATNFTLDKEKSALMEFLPRRSRKLELTLTSILGIPVVREYKYKGLLFDQKLLFQKLISNIRQKSLAIASKMKNELESCSFEAHVEAWKEFIEPLFQSLLPIYAAEETVTRRHELEALVRVTFRRMTQLPKNHSNEEVETGIGYKLNERAQKMVEFYKQSWEMKH